MINNKYIFRGRIKDMGLNEGVIFNFIEHSVTEDGGRTITHPSGLFIYIGILIACLVTAYLLGSINWAIVISKIMYHDDIRKYGSGNAGMTNMMRTYGKGPALITLAGDIFKVLISVFIAGVLFGFQYVWALSFNPICYLTGLFAMIGHIKPIYYGFKGGKGVLCFAAMGLMLSPLPFLFLLVCFILIVLVTKYISLGSIISAAFYPILLQGSMQALTSGGYNPVIVLITMAEAVILIICHRTNIQRLINHTENKFKFKKSKKAPDAVPTTDQSGDET